MLEWWLVWAMTLYGVWLIVLPDSMDIPPYGVVTTWLPPQVWGGAAGILGAVLAFALLVNGRRVWSPYLRTLTCTGSGILYASILCGVLHETPASVAVPGHLALFSATMFALRVAAIDSIESWKRYGSRRIFS